jgi:catechol 2,3-dioxygenase
MGGTYRLPETTRLGPVRLRIADLERSAAFYQKVLGLRVVQRDGARATLAAHVGDQALVELHQHEGARPARRQARLGLFHYAILLPERAALGRFFQHLMDAGVAPGAADHLVSEALYLYDPDGLGIEVYADRPRSTWRRSGRELVITTEPLDVDDLLRAAGDAPWTGMPLGTEMGHVHLQVGNLETASAFFSDTLGFDRTAWSYPGALFLSAGGYHHHLGTNIWAGPRATPPAADEAQLLEWTIDLPDAAAVSAVQACLSARGHPAEPGDGGELLTRDPWGTSIRLQVDDQTRL